MADKIRKQGLDKFYTLPSIAKDCIKTIGEVYEWKEWDLIVEPSAGDGSFLLNIPCDKLLGIDIEPENEEIVKKDFFDYKPSPDIKKILVIGNPPFGRVSSLAVKFFNHAANWADTIAFIIPRTFRRISVQNRLNLNFHLIHDDDIPTKPCSFSPRMMVKCCFQIWSRKDEKREIIHLSTKHSHWDFLSFGPLDDRGQPTPPSTADFALKAYGGKCGEIEEQNLEKLHPKSWHWIKCSIDKNLLMKRFRELDYSISLNTARQNSIGRGELVKLYSDKYR